MPGADPDEFDVRLGLWLTARRANPYRDTTTRVTAKPLDRFSSAYTIAESDIEAALTELKQLREENARLWNLNGNSYTSGWCDAIAAYCVPFDAREAGWRQYRKDMAELLANAAQSQPAPCLCGCLPEFADCGCGPDCQCAGGCPVCDVSAARQQPTSGLPDGLYMIQSAGSGCDHDPGYQCASCIPDNGTFVFESLGGGQ